ncbi:hypothetical protein CLOHYLEM_06317 [[Clostridium] hylemonae DSM 15053]|uniref:Uncharacterized protein n=2 Tax=[Clostridium] hylemonae TaxID=89153 RepID=C0C2L1_9FIRM|nr:hypothetical protein CLOHYLEM_06317 [[Clostridium] hylemonae DSM 15053]
MWYPYKEVRRMYRYDSKKQRTSQPIQRLKTYTIQDFTVSAAVPHTVTPLDANLMTNAQNIDARKRVRPRDAAFAPKNIGFIPSKGSAAVHAGIQNLQGIAPAESLILVSHGEPPESAVLEGEFGGYRAGELALLLQFNNILPANYSGEIYLDGCDTGQRFQNQQGTSYIEHFKQELQAAYAAANVNLGNFTVKGNIGEAVTTAAGRERIDISAVNMDQFNDRARELLRNDAGNHYHGKYGVAASGHVTGTHLRWTDAGGTRGQVLGKAGKLVV